MSGLRIETNGPAAVSVNGLTRAEPTNQASRDGKRVGFRRVKRPGREIVPGLDSDGHIAIGPPIAAKNPPHARPQGVLHQATERDGENLHAESISVADRPRGGIFPERVVCSPFALRAYARNTRFPRNKARVFATTCKRRYFALK